MSGNIILNLAISLDGFIADEHGGYDWIQPAGNPGLNTPQRWSHERFLEHVATVVMGRRCYDQQMHLEYPGKQVYVATSRPAENHGNIHFIGGDIVPVVASLREKADGDIYLFGGGIVIDPLLKAGLVDEYVIGVIPIILGAGIPLFLHGHAPIPLELTHTYVEDGVVILRYIPRKAAPL